MKKIEREFTRVEKEVYYEAWDGERFSAPEQCEEYENNARGVIGKKVQAIKVKDTNAYRLYEYIGWAPEDDAVEIFHPQNAKDIENLNMYTNMFYKECKLIDDSYIGKHVVIEFNYERDWCRAQTFDEILEGLKEHFNKLIEKEEQK